MIRAWFICAFHWVIWIFGYDGYMDYDADGSRCWWGFSTTAASTVATDIIPPNRRGEVLGYFGFSGNLALAFGLAWG